MWNCKVRYLSEKIHRVKFPTLFFFKYSGQGYFYIDLKEGKFEKQV